MNLTTDAPTALLEATTPVTANALSATTASSSAQKRIDAYVTEFLGLAHSDEFSSIQSTAQAVSRHGFVNSANCRYAEFLAAFRSAPHLTERYAERYPSCAFLPWKALLSLLRALNLWCDLPEHYAGAIPASQLPWMDLFDFHSDDAPTRDDMQQMLGWDEVSGGLRDGQKMRMQEQYRGGFMSTLWADNGGMSDFYEDDLHSRSMFNLVMTQRRGVGAKSVQQAVREFKQQFLSSFFVVAPPEAFRTHAKGLDWIERLRSLIDSQSLPVKAPEDPLVVRFCKGGCLVVAAWGDEAKVINDAVKILGV